MINVSKYLESIQDLTIIPPVLISVLSLSDNNELSFGKLENMVGSDQVLSARLLKLANTPFFSRGNPVTNMKQIITRLGFKTVRSMIAMAMSDSIFQKGNYKKFKDEVWQHSVAKGIVAQFLCEDLKLKKEGEFALIGGLMQDLGKIVLNTVDRTRYIEVLTNYIESEKSIEEIEIELFGVDNVEMGVAAGELWKLPTPIIEVIRQRNLPVQEQELYIQIINFAGTIVKLAGFGKKTPQIAESYEQYYKHFALPEDKMKGYPMSFATRLNDHDLFKFCSGL
ncbi:HDOD domain-containing protein [Leptospira sp. GIMC2001]|uniref:HDOD domain-containing protein n=1 Tax=Leptospira sp. GIMC2001 TaxID=1513297 RepID=UPI0023499B6E|nr:HDOD domain-containing protein [Leptospira sp. GIMC2001]WCL48835.1 HDOD domain-containing protein [Leptospira sp. GIMC2001]